MARTHANSAHQLTAVFFGSLLLVAHSLSMTLLADDDIAFFEKRIRPILIERCEGCHSVAGGTANGGLTLDTRDGWQRGGDSGTPIVPGEPDASLLIQAVRYDPDGPQMPPEEEGGKLPVHEIAALEEWVQRGAPDPRIAAARIGGMTEEEAKSWWAFQPLAPADPPAAANSNWPRNEIDQFVWAKLQSFNDGAAERTPLAPAPPADRRTLIRRLTFDLIGLPPTPDEVDAFVHDDSPNAVERVIDRLLASPRHGQRWARHWLDVVRYADYYDADAKARQLTAEPLDAWRYRDWVVDAFNEDQPFSTFVVHQIAGDLLPNPDGSEIYPAGLIATTFLSNGVWDPHDADKEKIVSDIVDDNIDTIGKAFLGLTLGCARCHDHKFDPVSTEDYYALAGMFYSSHILKELGTKGGAYTMNRVPLVPASMVAQREEQESRLKEITDQLKSLDEREPPSADDDPETRRLVALRDQLREALSPELPRAIAVQEGGTAGGLFPGVQDVPIHIRGSYARLGTVVARRLPHLFAGHEQAPISSGSGRRELAEWVAAPDNPLTARVIVNRVWQWHFGTGLVTTPNNFGKLGVAPTHPHLLDWLAARFIKDGWSLKKLHRRILLSATYQQSSRGAAVGHELDPENRWYSRFSPRRLEAEAFRDALLAVSGQLDETMRGAAGPDFTIQRRSLYVQTARWNRSSFATLFDAANPDASTEERLTSTVAPQALLLMNHPSILKLAEAFADRLAQESPNSEADRIKRAYRILFGRPPTANEAGVARKLIRDVEPLGWRDWAHVLLCSNEFVYVE